MQTVTQPTDEFQVKQQKLEFYIKAKDDEINEFKHQVEDVMTVSKKLKLELTD